MERSLILKVFRHSRTRRHSQNLSTLVAILSRGSPGLQDRHIRFVSLADTGVHLIPDLLDPLRPCSFSARAAFPGTPYSFSLAAIRPSRILLMICSAFFIRVDFLTNRNRSAYDFCAVIGGDRRPWGTN